MRRYSVGQLTAELNTLLGARYPTIEVEGEVSQIAVPGSGHAYLTLRDDKAVLGAVIWRSTLNGLRYRPERGAKVVARGRLGVFGGKGAYQLYITTIAPAGQGALAQELMRRKARLEAEGLLDPRRKRPLPTFPKVVGVATSLTGAALQDFLKVSGERFPSARILVAGCVVQGPTAPPSIVQAVDLLLREGSAEVIVVTRGGGGKEDLLAFQDEGLARFLGHSPVPVVSAVGHQIDTTLCDLVADVVVPTPTAAAVATLPDGPMLAQRIDEAVASLTQRMRSDIRRRRHEVDSLKARLRHPGQVLAAHRATHTRLNQRLLWAMERQIQHERERLAPLDARLVAAMQRQLAAQRSRLAVAASDLEPALKQHLRSLRSRVTLAQSTLTALSPQAVLERGYAVVTGPTGVLEDADQVAPGDEVSVRLARGRFAARVVDGEPG